MEYGAFKRLQMLMSVCDPVKRPCRHPANMFFHFSRHPVQLNSGFLLFFFKYFFIYWFICMAALLMASLRAVSRLRCEPQNQKKKPQHFARKGMGEGEHLGAALMTRAAVSSLPLCGGDVSFNVLPSRRPIRSHVAPGRARPLTGGGWRTEQDGGIVFSPFLCTNRPRRQNGRRCRQL